MAWDCVSKTLQINGYVTKRTDAVDPDPQYGLTATLNDVSPYGSHKAAMTISFFRDWGRGDDTIILAPGEHKEYTDPVGDLWRVCVDSTTSSGIWSTADCRACYNEPAPPTPASGEIVSIDVPAAASEGDGINLCATIKNVGGTTAKFFLRFYNGSTKVRETSPGNVAAEATIEDICEYFTMPNHAWSGKIELMRQT